MPELESNLPLRSHSRRWIFILLILAVLGVGFYGSLWAYGKFKSRQSRNLTKMATEYLQQGKMEEAAMSLETAVRLKPNNAEALRLLAKLRTASGGGVKPLETWRKLAESGALTLDDLTQYASAAAREGDWALAERLADAAATGGNTLLRHLLRAELLASKNDFAGAEAELREGIESDKNDAAKAALARFLLTYRFNAETASEVLDLLRKLSKLQDDRGPEAIGTALTRGIVPPGELAVWIDALRTHPKSNARALILADTIELQSNPSSKPAVIEKLLKRMQGAPLADRAAAARFLLLANRPRIRCQPFITRRGHARSQNLFPLARHTIPLEKLAGHSRSPRTTQPPGAATGSKTLQRTRLGDVRQEK
jgi:tetratricopeptide (TPR) repeat protein